MNIEFNNENIVMTLNMSREEALVLMATVGSPSPKSVTDILEQTYGIWIDQDVAGRVLQLMYDQLYERLMDRKP